MSAYLQMAWHCVYSDRDITVAETKLQALFIWHSGPTSCNWSLIAESTVCTLFTKDPHEAHRTIEL